MWIQNGGKMRLSLFLIKQKSADFSLLLGSNALEVQYENTALYL